MAKATCSARNCIQDARSRGWCRTHHARWLKFGDIQEDRPIAPYRSRGTAGTCTVVGCSVRSTGRLCKAHAARKRWTGDVGADVPVQMRGELKVQRKCSVEGCDRGESKRGFCTGHYHRWHRNGDPGPAELGTPRPRRTPGLTCSVEDCDRTAGSRGWCKPHYSRWQRSGSVRADEPVALPLAEQPPKFCSIEGCTRPHFGKNWCFIHYQRWWRTGNPLGQQPFKILDPRCAASRARHRDMMSKTTKADRQLVTAYRQVIANDPCRYCGQPSAHADHYYPVSRNGSYMWWTLVPACAKCNQTKNARCGTWFALRGGPDRIARTFRRQPALAA